MENKFDKHESYGMLGFYRTTNGGGTTLFGSSIEHNNTIHMRIKRGKRERSLHNYHYYGYENLIDIEMSYSQFYDAIANMNFNDGVPVTIRHIGNQRMENPPDNADIRKTFENEFKEELERSSVEIRSAIDKVQELLTSKKNITKTDKEEILNHLLFCERGLGSTADFIYKQFNEQMDKTVQEAKGEVECFIENKIHSYGLDAIKEQLSVNMIENKNEEN